MIRVSKRFSFLSVNSHISHSFIGVIGTSFEIKFHQKNQVISSLEWSRITALRYHRRVIFWREIGYGKPSSDYNEKDPILMSELFEFYRSLSGQKTPHAPGVHQALHSVPSLDVEISITEVQMP